MELSILKQFVILALNPEKGRLSIDNLHFRYSLIGALLMDYLDKGEISLDNKRLVPAFRKNGDPVHDQFIDRIMKSSKHRRIIFWVKRLANKSRYIFRETINSLEKDKILRQEFRKLLNFIPYYRYWFFDKRIRDNIIEELRGILLYDRQATRKQSMLLGLVKAAKVHHLLSKEKGETKQLRTKNLAFLQNDIMSTEINQAIREIRVAIIASVTAATSH